MLIDLIGMNSQQLTAWLSQLIGAAHAMEILFVFGSFDSYIIKNFLFGEGAYPAGKKAI